MTNERSNLCYYCSPQRIDDPQTQRCDQANTGIGINLGGGGRSGSHCGLPERGRDAGIPGVGTAQRAHHRWHGHGCAQSPMPASGPDGRTDRQCP